VRLADADKASIRAVKDAKGGSHVAGMTAGIVATGILFFPVAPLFLLMHGNDITVPKGAALAAYVNGDVRLESSKFGSATAQTASPGSQLWLLQSVHVIGDLQEGFRKTCVSVSPNGDYHREERKQVPTGGRRELEWAPPMVFEAKLAQAHLDALRAILATPELYSMNGVVGDSGSLRDKLVFDLEGAVRPQKDIEIVTIAVARSKEQQLFELADIHVARQQEPVSELLDWVKARSASNRSACWYPKPPTVHPKSLQPTLRWAEHRWPPACPFRRQSSRPSHSYHMAHQSHNRSRSKS
jgi:hypothetical protein